MINNLKAKVINCKTSFNTNLIDYYIAFNGNVPTIQISYNNSQYEIQCMGCIIRFINNKKYFRVFFIHYKELDINKNIDYSLNLEEIFHQMFVDTYVAENKDVLDTIVDKAINKYDISKYL